MNFKLWFLKEEEEEQSMLQITSKKQESNYDCGAAVLYSILKFFKVKTGSYDELLKDCKTNEKSGTDPNNIIKVANDYGLKTKEYNNMSLRQLQNVLDKGNPVIINIQAWCEEKQMASLSCGHYAIAIGYDEENIYFKDPFYFSKGTRKMPKDDFSKRWKDRKSNGKILNHYAISFSKKK